MLSPSCKLTHEGQRSRPWPSCCPFCASPFRSSPPRWLTLSFHKAAMRRPQERGGGSWCFFAYLDPLGKPCYGRSEAFHFFGRQEVRNSPALYGLERDYVELIEWDPRNAGLACEAHHRRFDGHMTPRLVVPADALPADTAEYAVDYGLESLAERRFG